jgi:hypothetical protein
MSYNTGYVNSSENKRMLWNLLVSKVTHSEFNYNKFQQHLDTICELYNKTNNNDINQINKLVLENCFNYIQQNNTKEYSVNNEENVIMGRETTKSNNKTSKEQEFNRVYLQKKESYDSFLNANKPGEVDFSKKKDEPITQTDIKNIVEKEIETRNTNIEEISKQYLKNEEVDEWLNNTSGKKKDNLEKTDIMKLLTIIIENQNTILNLLKKDK